MSYYVLDKAYAIEDAAGVGAYKVVVQGSEAHCAKGPASDSQGTLLGVTVHSQSLQGANVAVRKAGIARCIAAGTVPLGAAVTWTADGKVKVCCPVLLPGGIKPVMCLGFAETAGCEGDIIEVFIAVHQRVE